MYWRSDMTFEEELRRLSDGKGVSTSRIGKQGRKAIEELYGFTVDASIVRPFGEGKKKTYDHLSYSQMLQVLERGKDVKTGLPLDVKNLDSTWLKTPEELYTEIREREVILHEYESGIIECFAISTKTLVDAPGKSLHEACRTYKKGDPLREKSIPDLQDYAVSETLIKGEHPPGCVVRGFMQELGIEICENDLRPYRMLEGTIAEGKVSNYADAIRPSRVYLGLQSRKGNFWFRITFPEQFSPDEITFEDHGVELMLRWI